MKIVIRTFGILSDIIEINTVEITRTTSIENLVLNLKNQYPELKSMAFLIFVNGKSRSLQTILKDRDEVAFIPPFAGG